VGRVTLKVVGDPVCDSMGILTVVAPVPQATTGLVNVIVGFGTTDMTIGALSEPQEGLAFKLFIPLVSGSVIPSENKVLAGVPAFWARRQTLRPKVKQRVNISFMRCN
jgi:hypothetical protein